MFRPFSYLILLLTIWAFTAGCEGDSGGSNTELPWSDVTFADPISTTLSFVNQSTDTLDLRISYEWELPLLGKELPDTLWPGDSFRFTVPLYRPEDFVIDARYRRIFYALYPGLDRRIVYRPSGNIGIGVNAETYALVDSVESWDPTSVGLSTIGLPIETFIEHVTGLRDTSIARIQRHTERTEQPSWLINLLRSHLTNKMFSRIATYPGYYRFFYQQQIKLPPAIITALNQRALSDGFHDGSMFQELQVAVTLYNYRQITEADSIRDEPTVERYTALFKFLEQLPDTLPHKKDMLAAMIDDQLRNGNDYFGMDELIVDALSSLPTAYVNRLNDIDRRVENLHIEENKLIDTSELLVLLSTPFERRSTPDTYLLNARQKPLTLYKFWFAGCYPCLRNQPAEASLRKNHPDLEIISVAFSTDADKWKPYLERHQPPADAFFYVSKQQKGLVRRGMGSLGAPQYLLLGPDGEVICRGCPKPDDPALIELLVQRKRH